MHISQLYHINTIIIPFDLSHRETRLLDLGAEMQFTELDIIAQ